MADKNPAIEDLTSIYDQFNKTVADGQLEKGAELRADETKKVLLDALKNPEEKSGTEQMLKMMIPLSYTADHLEAKDSKATLYLTATYNDPEKPDTKMRQEMMIDFFDVGGTWKMGDIMYLTNPDTIKKSPDENFEAESNYDFDRSTSMGGRIVAVKFEKDYTLVTVRMMDENDLVYLPKKEELAAKAGIAPEALVPWKIIQVEGNPHKTNTFKVWGSKAEITEG